MLDLDTSLREIRRLDAELAAERAETAKLRAEVATMRPVFLRAIEWREAPHTRDSNCSAGDHDDCPAREAERKLRAAIDAADGEQSE